MSAITQANKALTAPTPIPPLAGEKTTNVERNSIPPAEIDFEPPKLGDRTVISAPKEPPKDTHTPEPVTTPILSRQAPVEPKMGDTRIVDGQPQVYFLGFGWIEDNDEPNIGVVVDGDGDISKMVGSMGGGEVGRSCGDINKPVGHMDKSKTNRHMPSAYKVTEELRKMTTAETNLK